METIVFENEYLLKSNELNFLHGVKNSQGMMESEKISLKCQSGHHLLMSLLKIDWGECLWVWVLVEKQWT